MEYNSLFGSKDLADVFVEGFRAAVDTIDLDDTAFCNPPEKLLTGEWSVTYGIGC
jgi:hypothetical protein